MAYRFEWVENEPILVSVFSSLVNASQVRGWWDDLLKVGESLETGGGYHIVNIQNASLDLPSFIMAMRESWVQDVMARFPKSRVVSVLVGTEDMVRLATMFGRQPQFGGVTIPFFSSYDQAMDYIRAHRAGRTV